MRDQYQGHVHGIAQQQICGGRFRGPARRYRYGVGHTAHGTQYALHNLFEIALALAQIGVFHLVKIARNNVQLRRQRPFGVVQALNNPTLDSSLEIGVLQQH